METDIQDLRKRVNECEVEAQLQIQYKKRKLEGEQDCESRQYQKIERGFDAEKEKLIAEIATEKTVNAAISSHLRERSSKIKTDQKGLELKNDEEKKKYEDETAKIKEEYQKTEAQMQAISTKLDDDV